MMIRSKKHTRVTALLLTSLLLVGCLAGCSKNYGEPLMTLGDCEITVNMFNLYLSRVKGSAVYATSDARYDSFWNTIVGEDGSTYADLYLDLVLDNAKTTLAALYVFDELGLSLTDAEYEDIDEDLERLMRNASDGGTKTEFNAVLSAYGVNYNILREAYVMEKKLEKVELALYGEDATLVSDLLKQDYMEKNYVRFKQIFVYTVDIEYEKDEDGNVIYFDTSTDQYKYNTSGTVTKKDEDGNAIRDKYGNIIFYNEDGSIAYDTVNGQPATKYDDDGNPVTKELKGDELTERLAYIDRIQKLVDEDSGYINFEALVDTYSEDVGAEEYPNGIYLTKYSDYDSTEVRDGVFEMEIGEVKRFESDYGVHIVKRYELDEGAFSNDSNSDFFTDFNQEVCDYLFLIKLEGYYDQIVIDEEKLSGLSIKLVDPNFYY